MHKNIKDYLDFIHPSLVVLDDFIQNKINVLKQELELDLYSEKDVMLIAYADQFQSSEKTPLQALNSFMQNDMQGELNSLHILPFYPWTCDDGFGVVDFKQVAKQYGSWADIEAFDAKLMFDCVFNHLSWENSFFQAALKGNKNAQKMFHFLNQNQVDDPKVKEQINAVVRPRTSPLFTPFDINGETQYAWTTFSAEQIDTNIANVDMMKYILESFFLYIEKGAHFFRVDAVPFIWKELGSSSSHHPKTHAFVKLLRAITEKLNPNLVIITESNVPHQENITYWGNGEDEAHAIYNFSLAPLILHAVEFQDNQYINQWAQSVFDIHSHNTFLNFTATHDGIGMRGLEGLVPWEDIESLCQKVEDKGAVVGKKKSRDGTIRPYELNTTWASFFENSELPTEVQQNLIVNTHAIVMFFPGIPAHYAHNFFGTKNWFKGYQASGISRRLNRKKLNYPLELSDYEQTIKQKLLEWIKVRKSSKAFHPKASIEVLESSKEILTFQRHFADETKIVAFNLTAKNQHWGQLELAPYELVVKDR